MRVLPWVRATIPDPVFPEEAGTCGGSELDIVTSAESTDLSSFLQSVPFGQRIALPKPDAGTAQLYLVMALGPVQQHPEGRPILGGARLVQRVTGDLERVDKTLLVRQSARKIGRRGFA